MPVEPHNSIPMIDLSCQIGMLWNEMNEAIQRVLRSGQFIMGPEVRGFEERAAAYLGVKYAIGVNSGTDALIIGLRALGIGYGDEVITTPFSFFATTESICNVGATPVFVDIEEESMNINPRLIEEAITENTKAIMPVHLFGRPVSMGLIMEIADKYNLKVIEDCAQSFGARYFAKGDTYQCDNDGIRNLLDGRQTGSMGDVGAFSFYPTKNLSAFGDGGLITTNDDSLAKKARMLQNHGSNGKYQHEMLGYNSRLDEIQASILDIKLTNIDLWNRYRYEAAQNYQELISENQLCDIITPSIIQGHVFHQYTVKLMGNQRDCVKKYLKEQCIQSNVYYPLVPIKLFEDSITQRSLENCRVSQEISNYVLSLPIWESITYEQQKTVVDNIAISMR